METGESMKKLKILRLSYEKRKQINGYFFLLPWIIGVSLFFIKPLIQSIIFSFEKITIGETGLIEKFVQTENYYYMLFKDPNFTQNLINTSVKLLQNTPIIIFFSLFIAIILNQKFKGRAIARVFFFLPVIITSGVVMELVGNQIFSVNTSAVVQDMPLMQSTVLRDMLLNSGLPISIVQTLTGFIDQIFSLTWRSGIQIILFLSGLQSIPKMYYEASSVEGASAWDSFWKITIPLLSPIMFMTLIFTIIDGFTDYTNIILRSIFSSALNDFQYGLSSAQACMYFIVILVFIALAYLIFGRKTFYMVD